MAAWNMKLARERRHPLPRHHPLYRRKLELSAEHTAFALGHRSLLENCPLFLCLMLGVHSTVDCTPSVRHENEYRRPDGALGPARDRPQPTLRRLTTASPGCPTASRGRRT